jgi:nitroalkane oxidase
VRPWLVSARPNRAAAPTRRLLLPARAFEPPRSLRASAGSFEGGRVGFHQLPAGIAKEQTFFVSYAERMPRDRPIAVSIIAVERPAAGFVFEHAIDPLGHRAHLLPQFRFDDVLVPRTNLVGEEGGGFALTTASFTGAAALVGILGVALMRAAFDFVLHFARTERCGGLHPIIEHQAVGFALADAKTIIEATRCLTWRACYAVDERSPAAGELAIQAKVFGSEMAVRVITDLMRVVGVDSYDRECHLGGLLQDALALPIFGGGNIGVRRRQLHAILKRSDYDPLIEDRAA